MGLRAAWAALWGKGETGAIYSDPELVQAAGGILRSTAYGQPPPRGARELTIAAQKTAVLYAVTEKIGTSLAAASWNLYVPRTAKGATRMRRDLAQAPRIERRKMLDIARRGGELDAVESHPLLDLIDRPNPLQVGNDFRSLSQKLLELNGEVFWIKERNFAGMPVQLWPVPSYWCFRTPFLNNPEYQFTYGTFNTFLPEREVVWIKQSSVENPYGRGIGLGSAVGDQVEIYEYGHKIAKQSFYNGAVPAGIFSPDGDGTPPTLDQMKIAKEAWDAQHRGIWNQLRVAWINMRMKFTQLTPKFADAQLAQLIVQMRDEIIQTYGLPPEMIGILTHSNKATVEAAQSIFAQNVLVPRLEFLRNVFQMQLVPEFDENLIIDYVSPLPDDEAYTLSVMTAAPWGFSVDEWRTQARKAPLEGPGGDVRPPMPVAKFPGGTEPGPGKSDPAWALELAPRRLLPRGKAREPDWDESSAAPIANSVDDSVMVAAMAEALSRAIDDFGAAAFSEVSADSAGAFSMNNPAVVEYLETFAAERIDGMGETTRDYLKQRLADAYANGESIDDISASLSEDSNLAFGDARAELIARTEIVGGANFATLEGYKQSGVVDGKIWSAAPGTKGSRDGSGDSADHESLDGVRVDLDEAWVEPVYGDELQHPGDGPARQVCNCRCSVSPAIDDPDKSARYARTKASHAHHEARRAPHIAAMQAAARKALDAQLASVIKRLKKAKR